ncbi:MAG: transketolase [Ferrovum sp. 37-45-19]|nr:MAG: transketolase [Ferrovum sp. 21-44-67]OYV93693.1 MAG: transketolase [Ferrovum sp. 37-45-19]OZB31670.1 MAG: transketolase [Ferrovum sp. 34-44-207]HQT82181.1 transketolase [Ferrovaceae bacterium]HQU07211.1 transketolase [Ferrovaceae bacterium]
MTQVSTSQMANAIRALAMDAVQKANSGHPGAPMGMADMAVALWAKHLKHNPKNPLWADRDRFVLSNGHGSMLIYALLHLTGYDLPIEEIKNFRQLHSKTPGHPEYGITAGIETTTGPLGQGITNAVGMALAERMMAEQFNKPGHSIVDHYTYAFMGDGCLMEGISHEACALAGTLGLNKLIAFWDDNGISIDGHVEAWFADDTPKRFEAYGWHVIRNIDGHNVVALTQAIDNAKQSGQPTLICCKTNIGEGSPNKVGTHDVHGAPLGHDEIAATRAKLNWPHEPFVIPQEIYAAWDATDSGKQAEQAWQERFNAYATAYPHEAKEFLRRMAGDLPQAFELTVMEFIAKCRDKGESIASRKASQNTLEAYGPILPEFFGGSADLTGSNLTNWSGSKPLKKGVPGNYLSYGVREFGMSAIMNGVALHGGFIPYGGTFLTFSDYSRNALRMAALMRIRTLFVFTHDSIGLGEDGPTHQSIEQVSSLRLIPNMDVWRPADTTETAVAWAQAIERKQGPSCLIFSRQNLPFQSRTPEQIVNIAKGGYVLKESEGMAQAVIIATGSEVGIAVESQQHLLKEGIPVRVVSMPSTFAFDQQSKEYQESVLPPGIPRVAIEAGSTALWWKYGTKAVLGIDTFGESAPAGALFKHFKLTAEHLSSTVKSIL